MFKGEIKIFFFFRVINTIFSHFRAHAFARSVTVARSSAVQASSSRRHERRWAIVFYCGVHSRSVHVANPARFQYLQFYYHLHTNRRRDKDDATRKILQMTVDGKRNRGRPNMRWRDLVRDDMARHQMTTEVAEDRGHWHVMIRAGTLRSVEAER